MLWQSRQSLHFRGMFNTFQRGVCPGLTDKILHSLLRRGCGGLKSLDISASSHLLSDYSISVIGTFYIHLLILLQGCHQVVTTLSQFSDNLVDRLTGVKSTEVDIIVSPVDHILHSRVAIIENNLLQ